MRRILVTAAGGAPAINFVRSVRLCNEKYFMLGVDCNEYTIHRAETDEKQLCPRATEPNYIDYLNYLIDKYKIDLIHAQPDIEVGVLSENREKLKCKVFLPDKRSVVVLRNKYQSYLEWKKAGVPVPETILLNDESDLHKAFDLFGEKLWLREIEGAAGKGSLSSPSYDLALFQIQSSNGWGRFTAAEKLSKNTVTWMSIYFNGELIVAQTRERLYWEHSNRAQSGVTGITGTGRTISDNKITELAIKSILAIDKVPHGIFSVDITYSDDGKPMLTEINIGKFFTTHFFFTKAGINFPEIYLSLVFGDKIEMRNNINPLPVGLNWIRGMDIEPKLIKDSEIEALRKNYAKQLNGYKSRI
ncbi:MAG: carboxylate--amine ligase [Microgenomates group bacterium]